MSPVLAYWDIRGLAQPIRLLLEYTKTSFEDKYFRCGEAPLYDKSCWLDIKHKLGLSFSNLPYYIDGDVKICQSNAIMRYIARKNDLCGQSEEEKIRVDMLENEAMDFRNRLIQLCYNPQYETLKQPYLDELPKYLQQFSEFLGERKYFAGEMITFPDFIMYELLDQHRIMVPNCLKNLPNLIAFLDRIEALPSIKAYMESDRFLAAPLNNKMAKFGNTK